LGDFSVVVVVPAWKTYWSIFSRTFFVLAAGILTAAEGWDWFSDGAAVANAQTLWWLLLGALLGALAAVLWAYRNSPAVTATQKALRAAVQAILASAFFTVTITSTSDLVELQDLIVPTLITIALAFFITYSNNQGGVPQPSDTALDPRVFQPMNKAA
jgi:hypothetical protein